MSLGGHGRASFSSVQSVMRCLDEQELPQERVDAGSAFGLIDTSGFRAVKPNGLVPALRKGRLRRRKAWAMMRDLGAGAHSGDGSLSLTEPRGRTQVEQGLERIKAPIGHSFIQGAFRVFWRISAGDCNGQRSRPAGPRQMARHGLQTPSLGALPGLRATPLCWLTRGAAPPRFATSPYCGSGLNWRTFGITMNVCVGDLPVRRL